LQEKLDRNIFESSTELERLKEERDGQRKELSSEKNSVKAFLEERAKLEMRTEQLHKGKVPASSSWCYDTTLP